MASLQWCCYIILGNLRLNAQKERSDLREYFQMVASYITFNDTKIEFIDGDRGIHYPKKEEFSSSGYCVFLNTGNVTSNGFNFSNLDFITKEKDELLRKGKVIIHDIVLTTRGTIGNVAYVSENELYKNIRINSGMVIIRADCSKYEPYFLYSFFRSELFKKQCEYNGSGSAQPQLPISALKNISFPNFNLQTQQKIAQVLSTLDRKIALNQQINTELEKMAKTLYDYWFVQFDFPDENGNPYKSSGGEMVYNPELKRYVPKGWVVKKLGEIADLYQPKTLSENELSEDGKYLVYGANGIIGRYDEFNHEQSVVAIACRGNSCGTINITQPFSWITGNAMVVKPKENNVSVDFIKNLLAISNIEKCISGSAQPQITRTNLSPLLMLYPPKDMLEKYSEITHKYFNQRINTLHQNTQLTQLRDFLLPMLMNGQVEVDSLDLASN